MASTPEQGCPFPLYSPAEVLFHLSLYSMGGAALVVALTGEAYPAAVHSLAHPYVVPAIVAFSMMGYLSVCFVLMLIKHFDATLSEIVKSTRKVRALSITSITHQRL